MRFSYSVLAAAGVALAAVPLVAVPPTGIPAAFAQQSNSSSYDSHTMSTSDTQWNSDWHPGGWYASGSSGLTFLENSHTGTAGSPDFKTKYDNPGYNLHGAIGRELGNGFRAEGELGYQDVTPNNMTVYNGGLGGLHSGPAGGAVTSLSFMANGYYDFYTGTRFRPYIGGGVGLARLDASNLSAGSSQFADDTDAVFAYQAMAGLGYDVNRDSTVYAGYRYYGTNDATFTDASNENFRVPFHSHSIEVGYRLGF